jgi:hypothetical protein
MISLLGARMRAEEFAVAVDTAPGAVPARPEVARLVGVASSLRSAAAAQPRPDFTASLRERLMAEAATSLKPAAGPDLVVPDRPRARERRLVAVAASVVLISGTTSMAVASQNALPGQALYPIKRGIEQAQTSLAGSSAGQGRDLLAQADSRLTEAKGLLATDSLTSGARVPQALDDFTSQADQGAHLLMSSYRATHDPATIRTVRQFAANSMVLLGQVAAVAPPEAQPQLIHAARTLKGIDSRATQLCASCAGSMPGLQVPQALLTSEEVQKALANARGAQLDNSHPVVVPRGALPNKGKSAGGGAKSAAPGSGASSGPGGTTSPDPGGLLDGKPVKKHKNDLGKVLKGPIDGVGGVVGGLSDGLSGVAKTLLPDPSSNNNLP